MNREGEFFCAGETVIVLAKCEQNFRVSTRVRSAERERDMASREDGKALERTGWWCGECRVGRDWEKGRRMPRMAGR